MTKNAKFQFSLRAFAVVCVLVSIVFAVLGRPYEEYRREMWLAELLEQNGALVGLSELGGSNVPLLGALVPNKRIATIDLNPGWPTNRQPVNLDMDTIVTEMSRLRFLRDLKCNRCGLQDRHLKLLQRCDLGRLEIAGNPALTDDGIVGFRQHRMWALDVTRTAITNKMLRELGGEKHSAGEMAVRRRTRDEFRLCHRTTVLNSWLLGRTTPELRAKMLDVVQVHFGGNSASPIDLDVVPFVTQAMDKKLHMSLAFGHIDARSARQISEMGENLESLTVRANGHSVEEVLNAVGELPALRMLTITHAPDPGDLSTLTEFTSLTALDLRDTVRFFDEHLEPLERVPTLLELRLPWAMVTSRGLRALNDNRDRPLQVLQISEWHVEWASEALPSLATDLQASKAKLYNDAGGRKHENRILRPAPDDWDYSRETLLRYQYESIERAISNCEFPDPSDRHDRPEDRMLETQVALRIFVPRSDVEQVPRGPRRHSGKWLNIVAPKGKLIESVTTNESSRLTLKGIGNTDGKTYEWAEGTDWVGVNFYCLPLTVRLRDK